MSDEQFEQLCEDALSAAGEVSPTARDALVADLRMRVEYAGEYVAYTEASHEVKGVQRYTRHLIAHAADLAKVHSALAALPLSKRARATIDYVEPLGDDLHAPHALAHR
jgi:hypothetical protein